MRNANKQPALLANLAGPGLPPLALNVAVKYQFCVDAGVASAEEFFDDMTAIGLHDHIALSMHAFMRAVRSHVAGAGEQLVVTDQGCTDAFAAGYLGRIQQELRHFRGEGRRASPSIAKGPPDPDSMH